LDEVLVLNEFGLVNIHRIQSFPKGLINNMIDFDWPITMMAPWVAINLSHHKNCPMFHVHQLG
jgi:hypothetical protein